MENLPGNMTNSGNVSRQNEGRIKKRLIPVFTLLLVVIISLALFFYGRNPERVNELREYRYLGAFLVSLVGNATVLLPGIVLPILAGMGVVFYPGTGLVGPVLVGVAGGAGAAIGEMVGYAAGYSGRSIVRNKVRYARLEGWVRRWGTLAIFIFSLMPLFFDLVGIAAGVMRYPLWKFVLICWLGRTILYVTIVSLVAMGWEVMLPLFG